MVNQVKSTSKSAKAPGRISKKKFKKNIPTAKAYIHASFNNTIVSVTDLDGNVLAWDTAGKQGFKGSRKSTPFAASVAAKEAIVRAVQDYGVQNVYIYVKGPGQGRESGIRTIGENVKKVFSIKDITGMPHNGCRPENERRV